MMEASPASVEMQDYWEEVRTLRGVKKDSMSEEDKAPDEVDNSELAFFEGMGIAVDCCDQELSEDAVNCNTFMGTLTTRQEEVLKRRVQTLNATLRQKRHRSKPNKPDIRNFFSSNDASSTGTRSRSATPDSLDSVSPSRTPPGGALNPKTWVEPYLSRSRGSLDSGNHSLVTIPCYHPNTPTLVTVSSLTSPVTVTSYQAPESYGNNGNCASIVTVSTYSTGSSSPVSSDNIDNGTEADFTGGTVSGSTDNTGSSNGQHRNYGSKYKYSSTYITTEDTAGGSSNSSSTQQPMANLTLKGGLHPKDNRYLSNPGLNTANKYVQTNHTKTFHSPHNKENRGGREYEDSNYDTPPDYDGNTSAEDWEQRYSPGQHRYTHYPDGRLTALPRAPSLDALARDSTPQRLPHIRRQRSYARDIAKDVKLYYTKGVYEFKPQTYHSEADPRDVQVLRYQHIGSMHIPRCSRPSIDTGSHKEESPPDHKDVPPPRTGHQRKRSSTDNGFTVLYKQEEDKFPDLELEVGRSGQTRMDWLHEVDLVKLKSLGLLELEIIFATHNISHTWRNSKKKKHKEADSGLFGVSLPTLLEKDETNLPNPGFQSSVPQILTKLISHLELHGLQEEGILRIPGNSSKTEQLRSTLDQTFYSSPALSDAALRGASPNDLVATIKMFLRMLPEPLLTWSYLPAFHKAHGIDHLEDRIVALTMLLLQLPTAHRETLRALLDLCAKVVDHEAVNRMGLFNVATIMAPNLFPPTNTKTKLKQEDKDQLLEYARSSVDLSQMLIKYRNVLWTVPHRLLGQIRRQYQAIRVPASTSISRLLSRKPKEPLKVEGQQGPQDCSVRVQTPQFHLQQRVVHLNHNLTVGHFMERLLEDESHRSSNTGGTRVAGRREQQLAGGSGRTTTSHHRATTNHRDTWTGRHHQQQQNGTAMTCLLRGVKHALLNHAIHEQGGNIGERRLDGNALLLAIYQENPAAELVLKCHHPGGYVSYYRSS